MHKIGGYSYIPFRLGSEKIIVCLTDVYSRILCMLTLTLQVPRGQVLQRVQSGHNQRTPVPQMQKYNILATNNNYYLTS